MNSSRRGFLRAGVAAGLAGILPAAQTGCARRSGRRANIIYLMTDQQKATACPLYGNARVPSPFLQQLGRSGIVFKDAYVCSPICTPSRTAVFTGVHPLVSMVTCHQNRAPYNLPQIPELLKDAGYYTAVAGHYENARNLTRGWHEEVSHDEAGIVRQSYLRWAKLGRKDVAWASGKLEQTPEEAHAHVLTSRVLEMLRGIEAARAPFFLHVAYLEPHPPYFAPPPYDSLVDPASVALPPRGTDGGAPAWQAKVREQCGTELATEADIRRMTAIYYGMIAYADAEMRRLWQALDSRGLLENTWIVFSSDHGDYLGEKGLFMKTESLYECLLHVPLVLVPPAGIRAPRGETVSGLVDLVDLFPTILGLAGVAVPGHAQGKDLVTWAGTSGRRPLRDCVFAQVGDYKGSLKTTFPTGLPEGGRHPQLLQGGRTLEYSFTRDPDYGDEAYDLRRDPWELENLRHERGRPEQPEIVGLRRLVDAWEKECVELRNRLGVVAGYRGFVGE